MPCKPVKDTDPELALWLTRWPTILTNLGSHHITTASSAGELARGLRNVLASGIDVQVLWKLKSATKMQDQTDDGEETARSIL